jgi:hypothetical protein
MAAAVGRGTGVGVIMKFRAGSALALFCLILIPAAGRAETTQDQSACMLDAQTYCGQYIPDRVRVAHCLMSNRRQISEPCRVALKNFK